MIEINVLKAYKYRQAWIFIRQLAQHTFEYWVIYRNRAYTQHFNADDPAFGKKISDKSLGALTILVANAAEGLIDILHKKYSLWYNAVGKHFEKQEAE